MDSSTLEHLLLNVATSTAGLAFGLSVPGLVRHLLPSRLIRAGDVRILTWTCLLAIGVWLALLFLGDAAVLRRVFIIVATLSASLALYFGLEHERAAHRHEANRRLTGDT